MHTDQHVQKILFENVVEGGEGRGRGGEGRGGGRGEGGKIPRAIGVLLTNTKTGEERRVYAKKEIILSAGAIGSPHICKFSYSLIFLNKCIYTSFKYILFIYIDDTDTYILRIIIIL